MAFAALKKLSDECPGQENILSGRICKPHTGSSHYDLLKIPQVEVGPGQLDHSR